MKMKIELPHRTSLFRTVLLCAFCILLCAALLPTNVFAQSFFWMRCVSSPDDICYTDGRVGIGTDNPQSALEVLGVLEVHDGTGATTTSKIRFDDSDSTSFEDSLIFDDAFEGNESAYIFRQDGNDRVIIQNGRIGVGTTSPNSKLEVNNGYVELATSQGMPPQADCDAPDEVGRMKVDSNGPYLYVCTARGWVRK